LVRVIGKNKWMLEAIAGGMILLAFAGLLANPKEISHAAREGIYLCLDVIIPTLFPFFVLSTMVIELGLAKYAGRVLERSMRPLFRLSGACSAAVVLGFLGGYPIGAATAISLYEKKLCSKTEAERLLAFCNNSGPAFILGAVGIGILGSSKAGWLLYLTHMAASVTVGMLFRFYKYKEKPWTVQPECDSKPIIFSEVFTDSVKTAFKSVFYICSFVIFFTVAVRLLFISGLLPAAASGIAMLFKAFGAEQKSVQDFLTGLIEITSGLWSLQDSPLAQLRGQMAMAAFMLGWAGFSVHCQVLSFIGQSGLSQRTYVSGKLLHGGISAAYTFLLFRYFGLEGQASQAIAEQVKTIARLNFWDTLSITLYTVLAIGIAATVFCRDCRRGARS